jgi:hypothetical protein
MPEPLEREPVTVIEEDPPVKAAAPARKRGTVAALMAAIEALPSKVAAELDGSHTSGSGAPEVRFVGDPIPDEDGEGDSKEQPGDAGPDSGAPPPPTTTGPRHARFRHPSAKRRTTEAIV